MILDFDNCYGMMIFFNWILVLCLRVCLAEIKRYKIQNRINEGAHLAALLRQVSALSKAKLRIFC